jgi:hypothetical protein
MQLLSISNLPTYLPGDKSFTPFGDPFSDVTVTHASPGVFTVPGYAATLNDTVVFSASPADATPGTPGALPGGIVANTQYFVVAPSGDTFSVSLTAGGSAISTTGTGSGKITAHFTANDAGIPNIPLPFKPGNTVIAVNQGTSALVVQTAPDLGDGFGDPEGPGTWTAIGTFAAAAGAMLELQLNNDWIRVSTSGTVNLLQN